MIHHQMLLIIIANYISKTLSYNNSYNYEKNKEECIKKKMITMIII